VTDEPTVFAFGDFEADEALRELRRAGRPVELQATPLRLLLYLLRNRDRVISKDELLDQVWSDTAVSEGALSTAVKEIRNALGDTGSQQRVIQTLRGQGYRLIATVEEHPATVPALSEPARGPVSRPRLFIHELHRRSLWQVLGIYLVGAWVAFQGIEALVSALGLPEWVPGFALVLLVVGLPIVLATAFVQEGVGAQAAPAEIPSASEAEAATTPGDASGLHLVLTWRNVMLAGALVFGLAGIVAAGWLLTGGGTAPSPETIRSIAVLPFADMSPGGDQEYFSDGMSEELINRLSKIEDLRVVARTSAFAFKGKNVDIREIGEQLDVGAVVEGSVRKAGDRLRITAQVVRVTDGFHLWSETYDRQLGDVFAIQDEVSLAVAAALKIHLDPTQASEPPTADVRAYELYATGRFFWSHRTKEGLLKAVDYFEQAVERDPGYAAAYAGLADSYLMLLNYGFASGDETAAKAMAAVARAIEIDDQLAEAHASLGTLHVLRWNWTEAERELRRALELDPAYATGHHWYAVFLLNTGRFEQSIEEIQKALALDPLSPAILFDAGMVFMGARDYEAALHRVKRGTELNPNFLPGRYHLVYLYVLNGMETQALEEMLRLPLPPQAQEMVRSAFQAAGPRGAIRILLGLEIERTQKDCTNDPLLAARLSAFVGAEDQVFECLHRAQDRWWNAGFPTFPVWDDCRSDPRFTAILEQMGLEQYAAHRAASGG
jgi:serine/threonine-protein kinase